MKNQIIQSMEQNDESQFSISKQPQIKIVDDGETELENINDFVKYREKKTRNILINIQSASSHKLYENSQSREAGGSLKRLTSIDKHKDNIEEYQNYKRSILSKNYSKGLTEA